MPGLVHIQTTINGDQVDFLCEPRQSLLEVLRMSWVGPVPRKDATTATVAPVP